MSVIGYRPEYLTAANERFLRRKEMSMSDVKLGGKIGFTAGCISGVCMDINGVAPIISLPIPHFLFGAGAGAAVGCIAGYGCYKLTKPQSPEQMLGIEMTTPVQQQVVGTPVQDTVVGHRFNPIYTAVVGDRETATIINPMLAPQTQEFEQGRMVVETPFGGNLDLETGEEFKKGGFVKRTGLAKVHRGEYVVPRSKIKKCNVCK